MGLVALPFLVQTQDCQAAEEANVPLKNYISKTLPLDALTLHLGVRNQPDLPKSPIRSSEELSAVVFFCQFFLCPILMCEVYKYLNMV